MYLSTPWVYRLAAIAYVEGPLCFYHAALVWVRSRAGGLAVLHVLRILGIAGAPGRLRDGLQVHGFGLGGHPIRSTLARWIAVRTRSPAPRRMLCARLGGRHGALAGQERSRHQETQFIRWQCRIFPSPEWDAGRELKWQAVHGPRSIDFRELKSSLADVWHGRELPRDSFRAVRQFWSSVVDVAGRSDWQSPLYMALAPLSLLRAGSRRRRCALVVGGIPVLDVVVGNAPTRSILAADAAGAGGACRPRLGLDSHA